MLKKTIKYTDFNGNSREEDFYFNLTKAEVVEMQLEKNGGLDAYVRRIINSQDSASIIKEFKELILKAYGEKSDDGKRFMKTKEITEGFSHTEAYSELFMELSTNADAASAFVNGIVPNQVLEEIRKENNEKDSKITPISTEVSPSPSTT